MTITYGEALMPGLFVAWWDIQGPRFSSADPRSMLYDLLFDTTVGFMSDHGEQLLRELQLLWGEFEKVVRLARAALGERAEQGTAEAREGIAQANERVAELEEHLGKQLKQGASAAEGYLQDNLWAAVGVAAAAGFIVGALMARRK